MKKSFSIKIFFFSLLVVFNSFAQEKTILKVELADKKLPFGLTKKIPLAQPKIGLALSGGGSRALSQIGVLKSFEEKIVKYFNEKVLDELVKRTKAEEKDLLLFIADKFQTACNALGQIRLEVGRKLNMIKDEWKF